MQIRDYLRLFGYVRSQRFSLILIFVLSLALTGLVLLQPWPIKLFIDLLSDQASSTSPTKALQLAGIVLGGFILFIVTNITRATLNWLKIAAGRSMTYHLAEDLFFILQRRSAAFYKRTEVGELMSCVLGDSGCLQQLTEKLLLEPARALLQVAGMVVLLLHFDKSLTLLALGIATLGILASFLWGHRLSEAGRLKRDIEGRIQAFIQQTLSGIPVVQAFAQEHRQSSHFKTLADAHIRSQQQITLLNSFNDLRSGFIGSLGSAVILWISARHILNGSFSLGTGAIFIFYFSTLQTQLLIFSRLYPTFKLFQANVHRVTQVLDSKAEIQERQNAVSVARVSGEIDFDNVTAGYETTHPVLKDISLHIKAGEVVAIVGPSGAGKTTLINLIPRFEDPWHGRILIDGHDVRDIRLKCLREQVAIVMQDSLLFPLSVAENIAYGRPGASSAEIEAAAHVADAAKFISALPQGYDTVIGERGSTLSGGMRQRIAIARAILRNAPILILDEATSALDVCTEESVICALRRSPQCPTTLIVAHRLSTVRYADRIVVLNKQKIAEIGTHDQLLSRSGYYSYLYTSSNL